MAEEQLTLGGYQYAPGTAPEPDPFVAPPPPEQGEAIGVFIDDRGRSIGWDENGTQFVMSDDGSAKETWDTNEYNDWMDGSGGKSPDGTQIRLFDVSTGEYVVKDIDPDAGPHDYSPGRGETAWGFMPDGSSMMLDATVEDWRSYGGDKPVGGNYWDWTFGYQAPEAAPTTPSWDDGLQGNLGPPQDPPIILQPEPPVDDDPFTPPVTDPVVTQPPTGPTGDWFIPGDYQDYTNAPQPEGDGSFVEGGPPPDTSWNWDFFREKAPGDRQWGGYDADYQAFERYQPGMDSPWGMPNIKGNNLDFYQQQFVNQLRDEQGFQNRERQAQASRQDALDNPFEPISSDEMWSWAYGGEGLPDVQMGTGQSSPTSYSIGDQFEGMSNQEMWNSVRDRSVFSPGGGNDLRNVMDNFFNRQNNQDFSASSSLSQFNDPTSAYGSIDSAAWQGMNRPGDVQAGLNDFMNQIYSANDQGPLAPVGYASPVGWGSSYNTAGGS